MSRFSPAQPFEIVDRPAPIVVAAPHDGSRPNVSADQGTGPIALALAEQLGARAVVAHDLRAMADVNKNPRRLGLFARGYAQRYQEALFEHSPCLVIEIHGHRSGQYEVEVSAGYDLDPALPGDAIFLEKLARLRHELPEALAVRIGRRPTVGVYPLDRDVAKTATGTFTFQKVRRARLLAGQEWYGLHVELGQALRSGPPAFVLSVAAGLAAAIRSVVGLLPAAGTTIPTRSSASRSYAPLLFPPRLLRVTRAPERYTQASVVVVHPQELESLSALDGDTVTVHNGHDEIRSVVTASQIVPPGRVGLPARLRNQVGAGLGHWVAVGRPRPDLGVGKPAPAAIVEQIRTGRSPVLWLAPAWMERFGLADADRVTVQGPPPESPAGLVQLVPDLDLPEWAAATSRGLAVRLGLTLGETVVLS